MTRALFPQFSCVSGSTVGTEDVMKRRAGGAGAGSDMNLDHEIRISPLGNGIGSTFVYQRV
jgi:hypothetical protein